MDWQVAEAKNKFSELMSRALTEGPQRVRGRKNAVVMLAEEEYDRLAGKRMGFKEAIGSTTPTSIQPPWYGKFVVGSSYRDPQ